MMPLLHGPKTFVDRPMCSRSHVYHNMAETDARRVEMIGLNQDRAISIVTRYMLTGKYIN